MKNKLIKALIVATALCAYAIPVLASSSGRS